jgi:hypothetical protein
VSALRAAGLSGEEARQRIGTVDSRGLVTQARAGMEDFKAAYARPVEEVATYACGDPAHITLEETIRNFEPTILIGTSGTAGLFTEGVVPPHTLSAERDMNSRTRRPLPAALLSLQLAQQPLGSHQVIVEDPAGDAEQLADERIAHDVSHARAFLAASNDVLRSQDGELLRNHRLIDVEDPLQLVDAALALEQHLEDLDADRVGQRAEEFGLETLQLAGHRIHIN